MKREIACTSQLRAVLLWLLLAFLALGGCSKATTLGDAPADHAAISGTPTWDNGIAGLMELKCAVCHQVPRLASSPKNVPPDLDLREQTSSGTVRGAEDIAAQIKLGVLRKAVVYSESPPFIANVSIQPMPPPFATPLYADEITALETWAGDVVAAEQASASPALPGANSMTAADGAVLFTRFCQGCHGIDGAGGRVQFSLQGNGPDAGPYFASQILSTNPAYPMNAWPALTDLANLCTPTTCNGTQLDAIAAFLAQF